MGRDEHDSARGVFFDSDGGARCAAAPGGLHPPPATELGRDVADTSVRRRGGPRFVGGAKLGRDPCLVPVVAAPGEVAVFTESDAKVAFDAHGGECVGWRNSLAPANAVRAATLLHGYGREAAHARADVSR